ncbi:hypothetical protein niasHT_024009 [Heterodera trifolii]|uniref:Carbohydrate kinase PfkB domain-containing protein n=1 Tax=Heterodera trifolii TaxID=157864 RepID=A0ABD2KPD0_9BILA
MPFSASSSSPFCTFALLLFHRRFVFRQSFCKLFSSSPTVADQSSLLSPNFVISPEIQNALSKGKPVVALESTLITHGLPHPTNFNVAIRLEEIVREENAVPATIALLDGHIRVGLSQDELRRISMPKTDAVKVSRRDLANCLVEKRIGGTTVAATIWIAHRAGIRIFATGGIGGVHRGDSQDVSADLTELGRTPLGVVCAGVKSILDIERTLEYLETQSVNVVVLDKSADFPGFFGPPTAIKGPYHTDSLDKVADILLLSFQMGLPNGTLIACPLTDEAVDRNVIAQATEMALKEAEEAGIRGKEVTPFVLERIRQRAGKAATELNIALLENNVRIAARLALLCSNKTLPSGIEKQPLATAGQQNSSSQCENAGRRRPKIVCAGASVVDFSVFLDQSSVPRLGPVAVGTYLPARIIQTTGGVARNHADALSRLGCDVTLISALGTTTERNSGDGEESRNNRVDFFGSLLMEKCDHIDWSHVRHCPGTATASSVGICSKGTIISQAFIAVEPIMERIDEKYIRSMEGHIANADFLLVDANMNSRALRTAVELARLNGVKVWFEPTNWTKVPKLFEALGKNALHKVSAISPNLDELEEVVRRLNDEKSLMFVRGLKVFLNSLCYSSAPTAHCTSLINEWIARNEVPVTMFPQSMSHLLVTCDSMGVLLFVHSTGSSSSPVAHHFPAPLDVRPDQIVSVSGAGDCFNSGFLTAILNGCAIEESVQLAIKCAAISLCSEETVPEAIGQWKMEAKVKPK